MASRRRCPTPVLYCGPDWQRGGARSAPTDGV